MKRCFALASVIVVVASATGCAMCCSPYDDAYNAYGGKWQRADMYNGRVGSAFHPAQGGVGGDVVYEGGMAQSGEVIYEGSPQGDSYEYYQDSVPTPPPGNRTSPFQEEARRPSGGYR